MEKNNREKEGGAFHNIRKFSWRIDTEPALEGGTGRAMWETGSRRRSQGWTGRGLRAPDLLENPTEAGCSW
jgi:hypothetical protein